MITEDQKADFIHLRASGLSFDKISKKLNISKPTLIKLSKELYLEIKNEKEIFKEQLLESLNFTRIKKLEYLSKLFTKIESELDTRDLTELKTDKLLDLYLKNSKELLKLSQGDLNLTKPLSFQTEFNECEKFEI